MHFWTDEDRNLAHAARCVQGRAWEETDIRDIGSCVSDMASVAGERTALVFYDDLGRRSEYTARELEMQVQAGVARLRNQGIQPGDTVCTLCPNHAGLVFSYLAAWTLGGSVAPLNAGEDDDRLRTILNHATPRIILIHAGYRERIRNLLNEAGFDLPVLEIVDEVGELTSVGVALGAATDVARESMMHREALIVYTSGTTGAPKGVVLTQRQLLTDAGAIALAHGMREGDPMLCVLPLHHVNGIVVTVLTPLVYRGKIVLMEKFHSDRFFSVIAAEGVTSASVVPTLLQFLLHADPSIRSISRPTLSHVICGAGPLTCELALGFEKAFGIPLLHGYGLSETTCYSCFLPTEWSEERRRSWLTDHGYPSIGTPLPCNDMGIMNAEGSLLAAGERGEIVIRGWNVMEHYYRNPDANRDAFRHGWFHSGDEGFFLPDGDGRDMYFITGRLKELIIRGGVNLAPLEIDEVLASCPGVLAGIAVGFDNDWYGEEVGALVIPRSPEVTEESILRYCADRLPFMKTPKAVVFTEVLPVTSTGKYQRIKGKECFREWKSTQFSPLNKKPQTRVPDPR